jgi:dCMP deaminase
MKPKFIDYFMKFAELTSTLSYAKRLQVGSVIVKNDQIIGTGYNGMPSGWDNDCEFKVWDNGTGGWLSVEEFESQYPYEMWNEQASRNVRYGLKTRPEVLHSEMNALMKVAQSTESTKNATLFCTHAPCIDCAKAIYQAGITTVYYKEDYRSTDGLEFLRRSSVNVHQYTERT